VASREDLASPIWTWQKGALPMQPPWKLVVEDLGRIGHAEIEARPLLLFVGSNNTGKTYLASLMWGLLSLSGGLTMPRGEAYERCVRWLEERFARRGEEPEFGIPPDVHSDLVASLNDMLREQGAVLASRTFNRPGFRIGKIELRNGYPRRELRFRWGARPLPDGDIRAGRGAPARRGR
jgi:hypothetical protein